ncbi:hypothetical protein ACE38V_17290 [Cytobacillus sp. Hz8]|uniref:hypothetical protein n=1 Tax=Cytobacillus sp. Hz8 TaxID=3347168 RepID=UPI0035E0AB8A
MVDIYHEDFDIDAEKFIEALDDLFEKGYITEYYIDDEGEYDLSETKLTKSRERYVERFINIKNTLSKQDKLKAIIQKAVEFGYNELKDIGVKVLRITYTL